HLANAIFSRDSTRLLCLAEESREANAAREFTLWDVPAATLLARRNARAWAYEVLSVSVDGRLVAYLTDDTIRLWDTTTGSDEVFHSSAPLNADHLSFSQDGRLLAVAYRTTAPNPPEPLVIEIWDVTSRQQRTKFSDAAGTCNDLLFSPDGGMLAGA